ncbi:hypothetical protein SDC9_52471 [bioreactor metagenome]|uniref:Uncharacterized protein n=1 Tax=bioreactor metagenome TaxID=1076179 RepID=A0A644WQL4_9ZZZZ
MALVCPVGGQRGSNLHGVLLPPHFPKAAGPFGQLLPRIGQTFWQGYIPCAGSAAGNRRSSEGTLPPDLWREAARPGSPPPRRSTNRRFPTASGPRKQRRAGRRADLPSFYPPLPPVAAQSLPRARKGTPPVPA